MDDISSIHQAIQSIDPNLDFSDPRTFTTLPFPSLLPIPHCFQTAKFKDNVKGFQFMGRTVFSNLLEEVRTPDFLGKRHNLSLYGTSGTGKSHLLAALVCHLVRDKKRVIYLPDCHGLLEDARECFRSALLFAFYDDGFSRETIENAWSVDELFGFVRKRPRGSLYLIIDQRDALELGPDSDGPDIDRAVKYKALECLRFMSAPSLYIYSAVANQQSDRDASLKQRNLKTIRLHEGMTKEETNAWFTHHAASLPNLSDENRAFVEHITGRIPLLLRPLILEYKDKPFDETTFLKSKQLNQVKEDVIIFYRRHPVRSNPPGVNRWPLLKMMEAILLGQAVIADKYLYDMRHFYFDNDRVAHATCGMAFQTLMDIYRCQVDAPHTNIGSWYGAISNSPSHIVAGYLAEYICLDTIRRDGMGLVARELDGPLEMEIFDPVPDVEVLINGGGDVRLYVPVSFNSPNVDAAIVRVNRNKLQAYVYLIQVTLATAYKNSETDFYRTQWEGWKSSFPNKYEIFPTFVWIAMPGVEKGVPQAPTGRVPKPQSVHLNIRAVNRRLHDRIAQTGI